MLNGHRDFFGGLRRIGEEWEEKWEETREETKEETREETSDGIAWNGGERGKRM